MFAGGWLVISGPGAALQAHHVAANVGDVEYQAHLRVGREVAQLLLFRLGVDQDRLVITEQEPDRHRDGLPVRPYRGQRDVGAGQDPGWMAGMDVDVGTPTEHAAPYVMAALRSLGAEVLAARQLADSDEPEAVGVALVRLIFGD